MNNPLRKAAQDKKKIKAIRKSFATVRGRQVDNSCRIPDLEERRSRLSAVRDYSIGNKELMEVAVDNLRSNGMEVTLAQTREEAISFILDEIGDEKVIVKAKSNVTKEIELAKELEHRGLDVIETDIGDRVIQIMKENPSHHTGPASHLSKESIADALSNHFNKELPPDPLSLTNAIRDEVAEKIAFANIGIIGANAIAAEEGAVVLLHNEGNAAQVAMRPGKLIIVAGIDKVYPNLEEAINLARIQTFYATGVIITSFINVISGPSKTADIEKQLVKGVYGPQSVHLILLDNGRSQIAQGNFRELLYCIGCGECLLECPAYYVYGNRFAVGHQLGGRGIAYSCMMQEHTQHVPTREIYSCVSCGRCRKNCPVGIDTPRLISELRHQYATILREPHLQDAYRFAESHLKLVFSGARLEVLAVMAAALALDEDGKQQSLP
ncbi:MAG: LUD domain-containing protein [Chloroflexota bacterium]|nr:LUD domain-containing protein [Chloroflexota bacterium]